MLLFFFSFLDGIIKSRSPRPKRALNRALNLEDNEINVLAASVLCLGFIGGLFEFSRLLFIT